MIVHSRSNVWSLVKSTAILAMIATTASCSGSNVRVPAGQNPSPMQEHTRRHRRIGDKDQAGSTYWIENILPQRVTVFVSQAEENVGRRDILVHFHGAAFIPNTAAVLSRKPVIAVTVHLGSGSSVYERPFLDEGMLPLLMQTVKDTLSEHDVMFDPRRLYVSAFSAGYGAVRAILRSHGDQIAGVMLLDGLHADYVPERVVLHDGGFLDESDLAPFVAFARMAVDGEKRMVITHSEIFPGTFASTTETADFILAKLGLQRKPVLEWGPGGMQLLSRVEVGRFTMLGFAGNTAPDHMDHLHGLPQFLALLIDK